ncbi:MAG: type VI secretion system baseplate subunit TssE [Alphaproteobacteria bacterium]
MARDTAQPRLLLSVLDRLLIETEMTSIRDSERYTVDHLRQAVGRDLELLLNTRQRCLPLPDGMSELPRSVVNYGIPDFAGANLAREAESRQLRRDVEEAIRRFEPRLRDVKVELLEPGESLDRSLRLRIDATVEAEPFPEHVVYDSVLEPVTRTFAVTSVLDV